MNYSLSRIVKIKFKKKIKLILIERNKEKIVRQQLHNGVGYSIYLDSKRALYSSTSLITNGTELISPALIYLSLNSQSRFEIVKRVKTWKRIIQDRSNQRLILIKFKLELQLSFISSIIEAKKLNIFLASDFISIYSQVKIQKIIEPDFSTDIFIFLLEFLVKWSFDSELIWYAFFCSRE
ncbi:hypothetical protein BpHYR1_000993 [Brachionus plicatilis]|uniref:Uncharacterized protein n=1 Tax=Brachionus plicatilis TaxID=10195 RepID=A0A3M7TB53_BRAPC|nr:hypothetical protein BpHYR1_000993 [Brachionus plicatilis]